MGLFCVNLHLRSTDDKALSATLAKRRITKCRVLPPKNGWISIYEEKASHQDDKRIRQLASGLSKDLQVAAIAFLVHDSDVACYWLFENGQLLDEYNSCPGYFDDDVESAGPSGGDPSILLRFCRPEVSQDALSAILTEEAVFADDIVGRLADVLGIDRSRALADYRHDGGDDDETDADGPDDEDPGRPPQRTRLMGQLAGMLGLGRQKGPADPKAQALVEAAAHDDIDEIDRLLSEGVAVDAEAPAAIGGGQPLAGLGKFLPGGAPKFEMTPLLAAVVSKKLNAVVRLLRAGADPNRAHPIFGSAVHAAVGAGEAAVLQTLIDGGGDVNARNGRGQTPLQILAAARATKERLIQAQAMMKKMGMQVPGLAGQLANVTLPTEGWQACEQLLKEHGAR